MDRLLGSIGVERLGDSMRSRSTDEGDDILAATAAFLAGSFQDRCDDLLETSSQPDRETASPIQIDSP